MGRLLVQWDVSFPSPGLPFGALTSPNPEKGDVRAQSKGGEQLSRPLSISFGCRNCHEALVVACLGLGVALTKDSSQ